MLFYRIICISRKIFVPLQRFWSIMYNRKETAMQTKQFKDYEITDFIDMGSLPKREISTSHRPFFGFNKKRSNSIQSTSHPVSNLADVL